MDSDGDINLFHPHNRGSYNMTLESLLTFYEYSKPKKGKRVKKKKKNNRNYATPSMFDRRHRKSRLVEYNAELIGIIKASFYPRDTLTAGCLRPTIGASSWSFLSFFFTVVPRSWFCVCSSSPLYSWVSFLRLLYRISSSLLCIAPLRGLLFIFLSYKALRIL